MSTSRSEELQAELDRRQSLESELGKRETAPKNSGIGINPDGTNRSALDVLRDLGAGIARGSQNLGSALLEGGEYITRKGAERLGTDLGNPVNVPKWNAREFMGLEGNRPIDLGSKIQSNNPDALTMGIGQFGLPSLSGGMNALRQILTQGAYGASQASPEQKNAFGLLPQGRLGAAIEGSSWGALPFAIPRMFGVAKNAINKYFSPETTSQNFIKNLGQGKTISENIEELSNRLGYGQKTVKEEALIPKREVMAESGETTLFPSQVKGKELTKETSSIFAEHPKDVTPERMNQYEKALKSYYNDGDIDALVEKGEEIFEHPGLSEKDISKLDEALIPEKPVRGEYLKIKNPDDHYSDLIQEAHDAYAKNPTFRNSDKLRSRLFKRINELTKRQKAQTITDSQENELRSLTKNRNAIIKDQENLISTFSPENKGKYGEYNKLWREDQRAYEDAGNTIKNLKNGHLKNVTPENITKAFSYPELKPELQKILKDIGPEGIKNIIYNELGRTKDAAGALKMLESLEKTKGFAPYISKDIKEFANNIRNQIRNKKYLKYTGTALGTAGLYEAAKGAINRL